MEALSGFAAVSIETQQLIKAQKDLLESLIRLLAGAIDAKSPYTGGHCQRVPVIAKLLAEAAVAAKGVIPRFSDDRKRMGTASHSIMAA